MPSADALNLDVYSRFGLALAFVLIVLLALAWVVRRFLGGKLGGRAGRRLAVIEVAPIDAKRRLVLVRRDDTEHLLLLGIQNDLVIETTIRPPANFTTALDAAKPPPPGSQP